MEEQLKLLQEFVFEEIEDLKKQNAELGQMITILSHNQKALTEVVNENASVKEDIGSFVKNHIVPNVTQVLNQQEQTHLVEIKSQHEKWYQDYQAKLQNNQLFWTGLLTIVLLGMFSFLATITDSHTRTIIDTEIKRIESQFESKPVISPHKKQR
jgi:hypothetical protein